MQPNPNNFQKSLPLRSFLAEGGQVGLILIGLVAVILGVAGTLVWQQVSKQATSQPATSSIPTPTPTPDQTANPDLIPIKSGSIGADWKTYTNTEYRYTILYPPETVRETEVMAASLRPQDGIMVLDYFKIKGGELLISGGCGIGYTPIKEYTITIAGRNSWKAYQTDSSGDYQYITRPNSNKIICFHFRLPQDSNKDIVDKLFDQILSTFKFLD